LGKFTRGYHLGNLEDEDEVIEEVDFKALR